MKLDMENNVRKIVDIPEDNYHFTLTSNNQIEHPRLTLYLSGNVYLVTITFNVCEFYRLYHSPLSTMTRGFLKPSFGLTSTPLSEYVVNMTGGMLLLDELVEYVLTVQTETVTVVSDSRIVPEVTILEKNGDDKWQLGMK